MAASQFANKRGVYLGRRSTRDPRGPLPAVEGKLGGHLPGWAAAQILLLDHVGAKSGLTRTSPLMYHEDGRRRGGGLQSRPANASCVVSQPQGESGHQDSDRLVVRSVRARVATDEERDRLWPEFVAFYPGYDFFQSTAKGRKIPIVILDPR